MNEDTKEYLMKYFPITLKQFRSMLFATDFFCINLIIDDKFIDAFLPTEFIKSKDYDNYHLQCIGIDDDNPNGIELTVYLIKGKEDE